MITANDIVTREIRTTLVRKVITDLLKGREKEVKPAVRHHVRDLGLVNKMSQNDYDEVYNRVTIASIALLDYVPELGKER